MPTTDIDFTQIPQFTEFLDDNLQETGELIFDDAAIAEKLKKQEVVGVTVYNNGFRGFNNTSAFATGGLLGVLISWNANRLAHNHIKKHGVIHKGYRKNITYRLISKDLAIEVDKAYINYAKKHHLTLVQVFETLKSIYSQKNENGIISLLPQSSRFSNVGKVFAKIFAIFFALAFAFALLILVVDLSNSDVIKQNDDKNYTLSSISSTEPKSVTDKATLIKYYIYNSNGKTTYSSSNPLDYYAIGVIPGTTKTFIYKSDSNDYVFKYNKPSTLFPEEITKQVPDVEFKGVVQPIFVTGKTDDTNNIAFLKDIVDKNDLDQPKFMLDHSKRITTYSTLQQEAITPVISLVISYGLFKLSKHTTNNNKIKEIFKPLITK